MDAQELRTLQEAYMEVYASPEELDERLRRFPKGKVWAKQEKIQDRLEKNPNLSRKSRNTLSNRWSTMDNVRQDMNNPSNPISQHTPQGSRQKSLANKNRSESKKRSKTVEPQKSFPNRLMRSDEQGITDSYDIYDVILSHLLDEGYAETPEAAEAIMVNMSEEWREIIVEAIEGLRPASERMARGVLTSAQRASQKARARREEKKKEELEKAANAILNQIGGASRRSSAPMGSTPAPQKAEAPEANRRIKPRMKSDDLASAADKVLRSLR